MTILLGYRRIQSGNTNNTQKKNDLPIKESNEVIERNVKRPGTGEIRILSVCIYDENERNMFEVNFDQQVIIRIRIKAYEDVTPKVVGFQIRDKWGIELLGSNTAVENVHLPTINAGKHCTIDFIIRLPLVMGTYSITAAVGHNPDSPPYYDWWDLAANFVMMPPKHRKIVNSKVHLPLKIHVVGEN